MSLPNCPSIETLDNCTISPSYIRLDEGGAIIPFLYAVVLLLTHIFSFFTRVFLEWKSSQLLTIILATLAIGLTVSAYKSTKLDGQSVYSWTPVTLGTDVGAMIHLIYLLMYDEDMGLWRPIVNGPVGDNRRPVARRPETDEYPLVGMGSPVHPQLMPLPNEGQNRGNPELGI